jgi:signal transduction histidine kinase
VGVKGVSTEEGLRMTVRDTGVGIAPGFRPSLFDPFKQESEGVAREYEGAGLGLTLTKQMVELLGGAVRVESTKGEGSTFTVDIPSGSTAEDRSALRGAEGASPPSASS